MLLRTLSNFASRSYLCSLVYPKVVRKEQSSIKVQAHSNQEDDGKAAEVTFYPCITIQHYGERILSKNRPM